MLVGTNLQLLDLGIGMEVNKWVIYKSLTAQVLLQHLQMQE